ncbi:MAG TPA: T9SS type A sorting domain-containing protein [Bacteroidia bacterium]|nr:T9SS type A sorting domain-containing protein [Bacteroidia bacterium]
MKSAALIIFLSLFVPRTFSQSYPVFGPEIKVKIIGLSFDAMEPFISLDGNTLFFNSLNSGGNTNLYYATRVNDSTFNYVGLVSGTYDPSANHLDGVPSLDSASNFFWVSLRNFPNLHRGKYLAANVSGITRTFGDFNILSPGWIIMDAAISYQGNLLYYCNAYFGPTYTECIGVPCKARMGVAQKVNDSTFNKLSNSEALFYNINDSNYVVYAPQVTKDGLELYYTRLLKNTTNTEICVSVRNNVNDTFSLPLVIHSNPGLLPEAASISSDKQKIYYHQKNSNGIFNICLRYRSIATGIQEQDATRRLHVYPNPAAHFINIDLVDSGEKATAILFSPLGQELFKTAVDTTLDVSKLPAGIYFLKIIQAHRSWTTKLIKE